MIHNHKLTVENHRNGLATAKMLNQATTKSQASIGRDARAQRLVQPSISQESNRGLQFESSGNQFSFSQEAYDKYQTEFEDDEDREDLEEQQDDFSEDEESEESQPEDEEEEPPKGETEPHLGADQKNQNSSAENHNSFGCASDNLISNSFGERQVIHQGQSPRVDGQPIAAISTALFGQFAPNTARSPPDSKKNYVGCTPECTRDPTSLRRSSHLKRLICRNSHSNRLPENDDNYKFNSESGQATKARLLRLALVPTLGHPNMRINPLSSLHGRTTGTNFQFR